MRPAGLARVADLGGEPLRWLATGDVAPPVGLWVSPAKLPRLRESVEGGGPAARMRALAEWRRNVSMRGLALDLSDSGMAARSHVSMAQGTGSASGSQLLCMRDVEVTATSFSRSTNSVSTVDSAASMLESTASSSTLRLRACALMCCSAHAST